MFTRLATLAHAANYPLLQTARPDELNLDPKRIWSDFLPLPPVARRLVARAEVRLVMWSTAAARASERVGTGSG